MPRRKVGDIKSIILQAVGPGATWSEIRRKTGLSKAALSKHLNGLIEHGLIKREVDATKKPPAVYYRKTQSQKLSELATFPQISFKLDLGKEILKGKFETLYDVTPLGKAPCDVALYLDEEKREILDKISSFLQKETAYPEVSIRRIAGLFVDLIEDAMFYAHDFKHWQGWEVEPLQIQKIIEQARKVLDFEATLLLHFNGKEIVRQIDWDSLLNKYKELDEEALESWRLFVEAVAKDPSACRNWLIDEIIDKARKVESVSAQKYLTTAFPQSREKIVEDMWAVFGTPKKAMLALYNEVYPSLFDIVVEGLTGWSIAKANANAIKEFVEKQREIMEKLPEDEASKAMMELLEKFSSDYPPKLNKQQNQILYAAIKQSIEVLREMVKEGVIEFVPIYLPRLNKEKANAKQWQAKAGYPSPTTYLTVIEVTEEEEKTEEDSAKAVANNG